jgi:hypothetical protein
MFELGGCPYVPREAEKLIAEIKAEQPIAAE